MRMIAVRVSIDEHLLLTGEAAWNGVEDLAGAAATNDAVPKKAR